MNPVTTDAIAAATVASNLNIVEPQMLSNSSGEITSNLHYAKSPATSEVSQAMRSRLSYMRPETPAIRSIISEIDE